MKRLISLLNLLILLFFVFMIHIDKNRTITVDDCEIKTIYVEFTNYSYEELKDKSDLIVLVDVCDEINSKNSVIAYGDDDRESLAYSVRHAKIVKIYKNTTGICLQDNILIKDFNAVSHQKYYYEGLDDRALQKNNRYVLFLIEDNMTENSTKAAEAFLQDGENVDMEHMYSIFCTRKGKIDMTDNTMNIQSLKYSFLLDYETPKAEKNLVTDRILQINAESGNIKLNEYDRYYKELKVDTNYEDLEIKQAYTGDPEKLYFEVSSEDGEKYAIFSNFSD